MQKTHWKLFADGASRNNPGPSGAGIYIEKDGKPFLKQGFFLGNRTNNQAEYLALLLGIYHVLQVINSSDELTIIADSELLVKQMQGKYRVKNNELIQLNSCARKMLHTINHNIQHVLRAHNTIADSMANEGIDKKIPLPPEFITFCSL